MNKQIFQIMDSETIQSELNSLSQMLKQQHDKYFRIENQQETLRTHFVSDIYAELKAAVTNVEKTIESEGLPKLMWQISIPSLTKNITNSEIMDKQQILIEIKSLDQFLTTQAERFFDIETKSENPDSHFLSQFHLELAKVVKATQTRIQSEEPPKTVEEFITAKEEINSAEENIMQPTNQLPILNVFASLNEKQRIEFFLQERIDQLNGTAKEWDCVRDWLTQKLNEIQSGQHQTIDIDNPNQEIDSNFNKETAKQIKPRKQSKTSATKKAAKKATKKSSKKK